MKSTTAFDDQFTPATQTIESGEITVELEQTIAGAACGTSDLTDVLGVVGSSMPKTEYGKQAIYTPDSLAKTIVSHFKPAGRICEPCKGGGAFVRAMPGCEWFEIEEGRDFLKAEGHWDWIVTNPPWKDAGVFLEKSMAHADNVVFLTWLTAVLTKARHRKIAEAGFGIVEMLLVPTPPPPWPQSGFQLAATWIRRDWQGGAAFTTPNY